MNMLRKCRNILQRAYGTKLYEPDYLDAMKPKIPLYETLNIKLQGYDFPVLEQHQKFVHNMLKNMDVEVADGWACPAQHLDVSNFKPNSTIVNSQFKLKIYERTVQMADVTSLQLPIILRMLESSCPVGVTINVVPHAEWHEEVRYIPDSDLKTLRQELDDMGGPSKKK